LELFCNADLGSPCDQHRASRITNGRRWRRRRPWRCRR
jgi:hypothetical protein